jgi:hypothetical protein
VVIGTLGYECSFAIFECIDRTPVIDALSEEVRVLPDILFQSAPSFFFFFFFLLLDEAWPT